ncbi:MAG: VWA domain-containing protein [Lachnospiraceae bacterium]|nr:VWA domain-containing protein [Lachnospiraceae bacterium]
MKKRNTGLCLLLALILLLSGCGSALPEPEIGTKQVPKTAAGTEAPLPGETEPHKNRDGFLDGIIGEGKPSASPSGRKEDGASSYMPEAALAEEAPVSDVSYTSTGRPAPDPAAGLLTAREWSDYKNIRNFLQYLTEENVQRILAARQMNADGVLSVSGLRGLDPLVLKTADGKILAQAVSDVYGNAVLLYDRKAVGENDVLTLSAGGEETEVRLTGQVTELSLERHPADLTADKLDLMLMVDTTGSMGDELEYLKKELANVVEAVYKRNPNMSIRVSVNFYRDEGDEYVVKYYDFRDDLQAAVSLIEAQSSFGGGDYPEAVHTALDNAVFGHEWREDAVKLCYLVFDAPPHRDGELNEIDEQTRKRTENIDATLQNAVDGAAQAGIRLIPVAASGANDEVEALGRSWAFRTGGTYIYLTNDSGIGYYHETPDVPETKLEFFNDCLIRVTAEYCGLTYEAERVPEPSSWDYNEPPVYDEKPVVPTVRETE